VLALVEPHRSEGVYHWRLYQAPELLIQLRRHHPRKQMIQYSGVREATEYWTRLAGMTTVLGHSV